MTAAVLTAPLRERTVTDALRDRSYEATPLGPVVARYIIWKRTEWGATPETIRDYEPICAKLALYYPQRQLADFEPPEGADLLRAAWDYYWGERSGRTRGKVRSVWSDFFKWCIRNRLCVGNPAELLSIPKKRDVKREPYSQQFVMRVIESQTYLADRLGCELVLRYALRRGELAGVQLRHFDFERRRLVVTGKGGRVRYTPIVDDHFWNDLGVLTLEEGLTPDHYLLYRTDGRHLRGPRANEASRRVHGDSTDPITGKTVHNWWHRCLAQAGYKDTRGKDLNMHRGRHTVATEILRESGNIVAAKDMLGHVDVKTTVDAYARFDDADLARVLREIRIKQEG